MLDSQGPIPGMTPIQALGAIEDMSNHSQKWHEGGSSRSIAGNSDGITLITNKLEGLGREMQKLKESVHAIQVGCEICEGPYLAKDFPLKEDDGKTEEVKYGEGRPFQSYNSNGYRTGPSGYNRQPFGERRSSLEDTINKYLEDSKKRQEEQDIWLKNFQ